MKSRTEELATRNVDQKLGEITSEDAGGMAHRIKLMADAGKLSGTKKSRVKKFSPKGKR